LSDSNRPRSATPSPLPKPAAALAERDGWFFWLAAAAGEGAIRSSAAPPALCHSAIPNFGHACGEQTTGVYADDQPDDPDRPGPPKKSDGNSAADTRPDTAGFAG
jgi:hypothetical protein